jgi:hypothetical protein
MSPLVARRLVPALIALAPLAAVAHPGHGFTDPGSPLHAVAEPAHAAPLLVGVAVGLCAWVLRRARRR